MKPILRSESIESNERNVLDIELYIANSNELANATHHKNESVTDILVDYPSYLPWLIDQLPHIALPDTSSLRFSVEFR